MPTTLASPELASRPSARWRSTASQAANSGHPGAPMGLAPAGVDPLHAAPAPQPGRPGVARARPLRAVGGPRLDAALRDAAPDGLRPAAWSSSCASASSAPQTPGHPERGRHARAWRSPPGRSARASPTRSASRWPRRCWPPSFNRKGHEIVDHRTWFICSDGDLMEGISHEAASIAGFLGLEKLVGIWDDNHISLDGPTSLAFDEDVPAPLRRLRLAGAARGGRQRRRGDRRRPHRGRASPTGARR